MRDGNEEDIEIARADKNREEKAREGKSGQEQTRADKSRQEQTSRACHTSASGNVSSTCRSRPMSMKM
jgi:hypothetical protein